MATLDDLSRIAASLPGSEERAMTSGLAWFVRNKLYAWEATPYPSTEPTARAIIASESCAGLKVAGEDEQRALRQGWPDVFLGQTSPWGEPKITFRLGPIPDDLLEELVTEAWYLQAPKYLRREFDGDVG